MPLTWIDPFSKRQRWTRKPVQPVHETVKPSLAGHSEFRPKLHHSLFPRGRITAGRLFRIGAKYLDRVAHHIAAVTKDQRKRGINHPHAATLSLKSRMLRWYRGDMNSSARLIHPPFFPALVRAYLRLAGR